MQAWLIGDVTRTLPSCDQFGTLRPGSDHVIRLHGFEEPCRCHWRVQGLAERSMPDLQKTIGEARVLL
ncbi:hypothetical protein KC19_5G142300 [Ceratodon purpureus]|uniref:Uncharacterized protein n=1 Tax=Ceratodon purpureus TaxID=3225 RepID=A0A8T0I1D1_CERPU|nr:hypothetical protein KC19_5G142300 [Ceratodon purpureus]